MLGHGSPTFEQTEYHRETRQQCRTLPLGLHAIFIAIAFSVLCGSQCAQLAQAQDAENKLAFRIYWETASAETWSGRFETTEGRLTKVTPLGVEFDSAGHIIVDSGAVHVLKSQPTRFSGCDFEFSGPADAMLQIHLESEGQTPLVEEISVKELLSGSRVETLGSEGNQITIMRKPGDVLRVDFNRHDLVFDTNKEPAEVIPFSLKPNLTGLPTRTANLKYRFRSKSNPSGHLHYDSKQVSLDDAGSSNAVEFQVPMPDEEGVYELIAELEPNWYQVAFGSRIRAIQRKVQLVVIRDRPPTRPGEETTNWHIVNTYQAGHLTSQPGWNSFSFRRPVSQEEILGNDLRRQIGVQPPRLELRPGGWQAIPITFAEPNRPHQLEIDYQVDSPMHLGISILETNESGQITTLGVDSGVAIAEAIVSADPNSGSGTHRMTIWPRNRTAYLLLANRHARSNAVCGEIRLSAGPVRLSSNPVPRSASEFRSALLEINTAAFPELFGARKQIDATNQYPLDDWETFYVAADRLVQFVKSRGYRGAVVNVASEGSGLFPCPSLNPSPRFDSGIFSSSAQDPMRKDILKMMLAMFEREGLVLIPSLTLNTPIPELEFRGSAANLELVNFRGEVRNTSQSHLPRYNPLNVEVQKQVNDIVSFVGKRYRDYGSMTGVRLVCEPDSYLLLAGREWGFDSRTLQRFASASGISSSELARADQFRDSLLGKYYSSWNSWRISTIFSWHTQLGETLKLSKPGCRLLLGPQSMYRNDELASALSPSLHLRPSIADAVERLGLRPSPEYEDTNITIAASHRISNFPLAKNKVEIGIESSSGADRFFSSRQGAVDQFRYEAMWAHFSELQSKAFPGQTQPLMRLQAASPAGVWSRAPYARQLHLKDSITFIDGSGGLLQRDTKSLRSFMTTFQRLPNQPFREVKSVSGGDPEAAPVAVRQLQMGTEWYLYMVNDSPWIIDIEVEMLGEVESLEQLDGPLTGRVAAGSGGETVKTKVSWRLRPFDLIGVRSTADVAASQFQYAIPVAAKQTLRQELKRLQSQLMKSNKALPIDSLSNHSFEKSAGPGIDSWTTGNQPETVASLDTAESQSGQASLKLSNTGVPAWIRSSEFTSPATGRLSVSAWIKSDGKSKPPVRIAIEGRTSKRSYYRFGSIGGEESRPITGNWQRFAVHFDDLPVEGMDKIRVGFDLMGPGKVWIDNVELFDRWFDQNDTTALTQRLAGAATMLDNQANWNAARLTLESYWFRFLRENFREESATTEDTQLRQPDDNPDSRNLNRFRRLRGRTKKQLPFR